MFLDDLLSADFIDDIDSTSYDAGPGMSLELVYEDLLLLPKVDDNLFFRTLLSLLLGPSVSPAVPVVIGEKRSEGVLVERLFEERSSLNRFLSPASSVDITFGDLLSSHRTEGVLS